MEPKETSTEVEDIERSKDSIHESNHLYVPGTDEEKKLLRKIDLFLLPTIWLMYLLSYMDRTKYATCWTESRELMLTKAVLATRK